MKRQLDLDKFLKWALFWIFILMWYIGIARIMSTVPLLMQWSLYVWATPLALIVLWFGISLAIRISNSLIDRLTHSWKANPYLSLAEAQRISLRTRTISEALKGLVTFVLMIVGIIWTLGLLNLSTSSIVVAYDNDPKQVLKVLRQVSEQLYSEPEWCDRLLERPAVLGIDDLSHTGMLVRVWLKTAPMQQWSVGREFQLRVRQAFEVNNIQIGKP